MDRTNARYEFRAFAHEFGIVEDTMRRLAPVAQYRESLEIYVVTAGNDDNNMKVRGGLMDIKVLAIRDRGLEQWCPGMKSEFPLSRSVIEGDVFPRLGVPAPNLQRAAYTLQQFVNEIVRPLPELAAVSVYKQRFGFDIDGCTAELADLFINGALLRTACIESADMDQVLHTRARLHLDEYENVNYVLATKRVIGMAPLPEGAFYRAC